MRTNLAMRTALVVLALGAGATAVEADTTAMAQAQSLAVGADFDASRPRGGGDLLSAGRDAGLAYRGQVASYNFITNIGEGFASLGAEPVRRTADLAERGWRAGNGLELPSAISFARPVVRPVAGAVCAAAAGAAGLAVGTGAGIFGFLRHAALAVAGIFSF